MEKMQVPALLFILVQLISGCTYRFTNQHVRLPPNVKSIAIEAVYDTSREVVPHEILWESLQRAFAADGHLQVVSQGSADSLLRVHLTEVGDAPTGSGEITTPDKDQGTDQTPPPPSYFRTLPEAGEFTTKQNLRVAVKVEIIDLYSRAIIFTNSYEAARTFRSYRSETKIAQKKSHFLLFEEARTAKFKEISDEIAADVVRDFLVGR